MASGEAGARSGREAWVPDGVIRQSQEQEVPQRTAQRAGRENARALRALNEGARLSPRGRIAVAKQPSRTTAFAHANASENAFRLRAPFAPAYVRDGPG